MFSKPMAAVTLGAALSRCFPSRQRAYNAVVCYCSCFSHTTLLQCFVLLASILKKSLYPKQRDKQGAELNCSVVRANLTNHDLPR